MRNQTWNQYIDKVNRLSQITKEEVVAFAKEKFNDNHLVIYKREGPKAEVQKVVKPEITPVKINQDARSDFATELLSRQPQPLQPLFLDFEQDIQSDQLRPEVPIYAHANQENDLFTLQLIYNFGRLHDQRISLALSHFDFLGTESLTSSQIKQEFYKLGCDLTTFAERDQVIISLSGLQSSMAAALQLWEKIWSEAQPNDQALQQQIKIALKQRENNKKSKTTIFDTAMMNYAVYGPDSLFRNVMSEKELKALTSAELVELVQSLRNYPHRILYYGPASIASIKSSLNNHHVLPDAFLTIPERQHYEQLPTTKNQVLVVDYEMKQVEIRMLSKLGPYDRENRALFNLFNTYFGSGLSSIVTLTLRESRALAYSAYAIYTTPRHPDDAHYLRAYIGTQSDKLSEAMHGMLELLNDMPRSDKFFSAAKESTSQKIRSERVVGFEVLNYYDVAQKFGFNDDIRRKIYEAIPDIDYEDMQKIFDEQVKGRHYTMLLIGDTKLMDMDVLSQFGEVKVLSLEELFGY